MRKLKYKISVVSSVVLLIGAVGCTDLEDKVLDRPTDLSTGTGSSNAVGLLNAAYAQLNSFTDQAGVYALQEHPSDEMMGPTRGTDWDDFGTWRRLHQHTWDAAHNQVNDSWDRLNTGIFRSTEALAAAGNDASIAAQAQFLRAFFMFHVVDLFGQVPLREANASFDDIPRVLNRVEATDYMIQDLEAALAVLPAMGANADATPGKATKEAAQFLLAKIYLNKAVFTQDPQQPAGPFNFTPADMSQVIQHCDAIINSGQFQLEPAGQYFDNFHWDNSSLSKELVFVIANARGAVVGNVQNRYRMTLHYNQQPDGWNGFTTLADFYNSFEQQDERRYKEIPGMTDVLGLNAGFLVGQQTGPNDRPLTDRGGAPLVFTPDVDLLYSDEKLGIRVIKYLPEPGNFGNQGTDYIFFRYSDVLLMKAEALLRGGSGAGSPAAIVNEIRTNRGATTLAALDLPVLLAERGRELYWEGWRRNDQVRFGTFLEPMQEKPQPSPPYRVVFPIPQRALDTNPNLAQNFGY